MALDWRKLGAIFLHPEEHTRIVAVNCDEEKELCKRENVKEFPTLLLYRKGTIVPYTGPSRTFASLLAFMTNHADIPVQFQGNSNPLPVDMGFSSRCMTFFVSCLGLVFGASCYYYFHPVGEHDDVNVKEE